MAQMNPPEMQETQVQSLGWGDPLEEDMATHSNVLAWKIPTDRGACWAVVHGVAESDTMGRLSTAAHGFAQRRGKKDSPWQGHKGLTRRLGAKKAVQHVQEAGLPALPALGVARGGLGCGRAETGWWPWARSEGLRGVYAVSCDFTLIV